jgi:hypothetical protein
MNEKIDTTKPSNKLPPAYGGCTCGCHVLPGVIHEPGKPCCTPELGKHPEFWPVSADKPKP